MAESRENSDHLPLAAISILADSLKDLRKDIEAVKEYETVLKVKPDYGNAPNVNQCIDYLKGRRI